MFNFRFRFRVIVYLHMQICKNTFERQKLFSENFVLQWKFLQSNAFEGYEIAKRSFFFVLHIAENPDISFNFSLANVNAEDLREGISVPSPFVCFQVMCELVNLVFFFRFIMPQI